VQDGEFSWDFDVPEGFVSEYSRSPFLRGASVSGPVRRLCPRSGGHPDHGGRCADPASGEARERIAHAVSTIGEMVPPDIYCQINSMIPSGTPAGDFLPAAEEVITAPVLSA